MSAVSAQTFRTLVAAAVAVSCLAGDPARTDEGRESRESVLRELGEDYRNDVRPLLERYCHRCHSGDRTEAEIDLGAVETFADVRKRPRTWQRVREMLDTAQMPPGKARQPSDDERGRLRKWVRDYLTSEARARAGDPGRVVLRRLSNTEYTYTVRELTGVDSLDPTREFPVDGAAGEGFTNTGDALVMSPSLVTKYLEAAKGIARHAVLLPDGIRFSPHTTPRDWTDDLLESIRGFYREFSDEGGGMAVDLQGIKFDTNQGGRLPLEKYIAATLAEREALALGAKTVESVARERDLNARYLGTLFEVLTAEVGESRETQSPLLDRVRARWRAAGADDVRGVAEEIVRWQNALWKFNSIGHIGRQGGPRSWMEAVSPITARQEFRVQLPEESDGEDVVLFLAAGDAGDGNAADYVVWRNPRLTGGGQADLPLRQVAGLRERLAETRREMLADAARYLAAAAESGRDVDVDELAARHGVEVAPLRAWLEYLAVDVAGPVEVSGHFTEKLPRAGNYDFVRGWGSRDTPSIVANASDQEVRIPGIARPHSVVAHPSPTLFAAVGWQSPVDGVVRVEARLADAHPECGNGVEWRVRHSTGRRAETLWRGDFATGGSATMPPKSVAARRGDLVSFILGPRQGNHACDLTEINLVITEVGAAGRVWDLARDVSGTILASNPHADGHGNAATWHFYRGAMADVLSEKDRPVAVPAGSVLARWQAEEDAGARSDLALRVQALATGEPPSGEGSPDALLYAQLQKLAIPVDRAALLESVTSDARFGRHPLGHAVDAADLVVRAPAVVEFRVPAELAAGRELVVTGELDPEHGREGSVQLQAARTRPEGAEILRADLPVVANEGSESATRLRDAFDRFRDLFPVALCYTKIVPVDEVVTLTLFHREDEPLRRLMLSADEIRRLDRLWDELFFVSREPLKLVTALEQIIEFATQDRPDLVVAFKPLEKPINDRAAAFRQRLVDTEPTHVAAVLDFAGRAWRRPLLDAETKDLRALYDSLRDSGIDHEEAIRLTIARVLTSPAFLYRLEDPPPGERPAPVSGLELASRLSYFLWSSMPDAELRRVAESGELTDDATLVAQARRMLRDPRTRRLAIEFGCQWLHVHDFDQNDEKNEALYPEFASLRGAMYEECVRFLEDLFRNDGSVLDLLDADHTFLNPALAKHYGIDGVELRERERPRVGAGGDGWRRVDGVKGSGRGGVLAMAAVLAKQSGASRTSPVLRGNWVFETLLGERLPRPPPNVPQLPDAVPDGLTARQLIERHSSAPECAGCHEKIDPYGFALEQYDAIGRLRPEAVDTSTRLPDGAAIEGLDGLREYLLEVRRSGFLAQFCRKLLGYAVGRAVQLSDEPLLAEMQRELEANDHRFGVAIEMIVRSRQFRDIRGEAFADEE